MLYNTEYKDKEVKEVMRLIGRQNIPTAEELDQIDKVFKAYKENNSLDFFSLALDTYTLGVIAGKRKERAKHNG